MISHSETQELHEIIGGVLEALTIPDPWLGSLVAETQLVELARARELAALVVSDTETAAAREYGVRTYGGHVSAKPSMHVADREVQERQAAGEKNVWRVSRLVTDWEVGWG